MERFAAWRARAGCDAGVCVSWVDGEAVGVCDAEGQEGAVVGAAGCCWWLVTGLWRGVGDDGRSMGGKLGRGTGGEGAKGG